MSNTSKDKVCCPGCGQGWVVRVRVPLLNRELFVCEECETTWLRREDIGVVQPLNFVNFMRENGLKGLWTELERVADN
jgi:ribosomal protein L37AE/L43A